MQTTNGDVRPRIGVLAIQGDFAAHAQALHDAGADAVEVRKASELAGLDGLILPGGESTNREAGGKAPICQLVQSAFAKTEPRSSSMTKLR